MYQRAKSKEQHCGGRGDSIGDHDDASRLKYVDISTTSAMLYDHNMNLVVMNIHNFIKTEI